MRYKKGTKVEVLTKREQPSGSWRCAEILSGNGHTYFVKYEPSQLGTTEFIERVPRKVIRPCPPTVQGRMGVVPGDIVEVFDNGFWKLAVVICVSVRNYLCVRLIGAPGAFEVCRSAVRLRQCWEDNRWISIGKERKDSDNGELLKDNSKNHNSEYIFKKVQRSDECNTVGDFIWMPSAAKKRNSNYHSLPAETCDRCTKRMRACDQGDSIQHQLVADNLFLLQNKVDAVASPQKKLGEDYMHASLNYCTWLPDVNMENGRPNSDIGCAYTVVPEPSDASLCSSIGSNDLDTLSHFSSKNLRLDMIHMNDLSDDAGSSCGVNPTVLKDNLVAKVHELELYAYRTTMKALYSSGPISWEQEELITNLRIELHISNDEHLLELRHLSSSKLDFVSCIDAATHLS